MEACSDSVVVDLPNVSAVDRCEGPVAVTRRLVELNGYTVDVPLGENLELPADSFAVVEFVAADSAGNTTTTSGAVFTYRGASCCPEGLRLGPAGNGKECSVGGPADDTLDAGNGGDWLSGGLGADRLFGGNGSDTLYGGPGADELYGGHGSDILSGGSGDDLLEGGSGADELEGGPGADVLRGGLGPDVFWLRSSCHAQAGEVIDGGGGRDVLYSPLSLSQLAARGVTVSRVEGVLRIEDAGALGGCDG